MDVKAFYHQPWRFDSQLTSFLKSDRDTLPDMPIRGPQGVAECDMDVDTSGLSEALYGMMHGGLGTVSVPGIDILDADGELDANRFYWQAIQNHDLEMMRQALLYGADVTFRIDNQCLAWYTFQTLNFDLICLLAVATKYYALHAVYLAIVYNNMYALDFLLKMPGVDVNGCPEPTFGTPLELAVSYGRHLAVRVMIQYGAKLTNRAFQTVCHYRLYAIFNTFIDADYCIEATKQTILDQAAKSGNWDIVLYLKARGAIDHDDTPCHVCLCC